jgi:hypothetical protein
VACEQPDRSTDRRIAAARTPPSISPRDQALTLMPPLLRLPSRSPSESLVTEAAGTAGFVAGVATELLAAGALVGNELAGGMLETVMFHLEKYVYEYIQGRTLHCKVESD